MNRPRIPPAAENLNLAEETELYLDAAEHEVGERDWKRATWYLSRVSPSFVGRSPQHRSRYERLVAALPPDARNPAECNPVGRPSRSRFDRERLRSPKDFDPSSFRTKVSGSHRVVIGCPLGRWDPAHTRCKAGTRAQAVLHPAEEAAFRGRRRAAANPVPC
jgi:hypothetical protein